MYKNKNIVQDLSTFFNGEIETSKEATSFYSHDASLFEIQPDVVVFPKDVADICGLVSYINQNKADNPNLSLTARSGGTDMGGGAINDSIVVAFEKHFKGIGLPAKGQITVQPGVYYRDFERETLKQNLLMPSYPASREICMIGGMVANNAGGEKSLIYGKTDRYVTEIKIVLRDGREHTFRPLNKAALQNKLQEDGIEGDLYRKIYSIVTENADLIKKSKLKVSKNSTGYNLWDVWDEEIFDINKIIVGSQGTLGLITQVTFRLVRAQPLSGTIVAFIPSLKNLGEIIKAILPLRPTCMESFDEHTLKFAFRFFLSFRKTLGWKRFIILGLSFIPVLGKLMRYLPRLPKVIMLIQFEGDSQDHINNSFAAVENILARLNIDTHRARDKKHEEKFWIMRRESFNLLRKNIKRKHTAPFIDDLIVPTDCLPDFLPQLTEILNRYKLSYTVAGHMGDGNFHIIPLMDLTLPSERDKIAPILEEVTKLILLYGGSLSGEHNDGLIRGPFLNLLYNNEMMELFREVKNLFDPDKIFNPHKKLDASWQYSEAHMRKKF
jgi:FAD/FMN-containing dehydrogenase